MTKINKKKKKKKNDKIQNKRENYKRKKKRKKMNECGEGEYVCNEVRMLSKRKKIIFFSFPGEDRVLYFGPPSWRQ
jgi:hypothetical protein